jgi:hypothetical protein
LFLKLLGAGTEPADAQYVEKWMDWIKENANNFEKNRDTFNKAGLLADGGPGAEAGIVEKFEKASTVFERYPHLKTGPKKVKRGREATPPPDAQPDCKTPGADPNADDDWHNADLGLGEKRLKCFAKNRTLTLDIPAAPAAVNYQNEYSQGLPLPHVLSHDSNDFDMAGPQSAQFVAYCVSAPSPVYDDGPPPTCDTYPYPPDGILEMFNPSAELTASDCDTSSSAGGGAAGGSRGDVTVQEAQLPASLSSSQNAPPSTDGAGGITPVFLLLLDAMHGVEFGVEKHREEWFTYDVNKDFQRWGYFILSSLTRLRISVAQGMWKSLYYPIPTLYRYCPYSNTDTYCPYSNTFHMWKVLEYGQ